MNAPSSEQRTFEPCYCKRCRGRLSAPCRFRGKSWLQLLWLRIWCALDGHGGITTLSGNEFKDIALCKRCGTTVRLI